jgi:hypothetical protein
MMLFSILSYFWFKLPFADRYWDIFVRIYPFLMDRILPTVFRFWLFLFRYRPNKNLYEWKWWEGFPDRFRPFSPLPITIHIVPWFPPGPAISKQGQCGRRNRAPKISISFVFDLKNGLLSIHRLFSLFLVSIPCWSTINRSPLSFFSLSFSIDDCYS